MKIRNNQEKANIDIKKLLSFYRKKRNFKAEIYLKNKVKTLKKYFKKNKITAAVVGVSGGIDSAIVLGILKELQKNIKIKIYPFLLPAQQIDGVTNQVKATEKGERLCKSYNLKFYKINLQPYLKQIYQDLENEMQIKSDSWARGQLVSYLRTPLLYYATSLLSCQKDRACVIGTTNLDEGAYLGYFGKASDGMVDLQIISDLHKSEVKKLAKYLQVSSSIIKAPPNGDLFDGKTDEEVFGTSYDYVELYYFAKNHKKEFIQQLKHYQINKKIIDKHFDKIVKMHKYNQHKYLAYSPAIHFDINSTKHKNGWKYANYPSK